MSVLRRAALAVAPLLLVGLLAAPSAAGEAPGESTRAPGEARLEARLMAPCCWLQTLDVHSSPLSTELRAEIRTRLLAGESPDTIEDDLVARYGERIRAVAKGHEPGGPIPILVGVGMVVSAAALLAMIRRWRRASVARAPVPPAGGADDRYDRILDEELRALDE